MLIDAYKDLVPTNNITKPKFMGFLDAILTPAIQLGALVETLGYAFDLGNAAGDQLDIIGELVGVSRLLPEKPSIGDRLMNDEEYLMCIRLKIAQNEWDGTNESAINAYKDAMGDRITVTYVDNQNMSVDIIVSGTTTTREAEVLFLSDSLLVPAGTRACATSSDPNLRAGIRLATNVSGELIYQSVKMVKNHTGSYTVETIQDLTVEQVQQMQVDWLQN